MLQESVYCKISLTQVCQRLSLIILERINQKTGLVQVLKITEKQYSRMECIIGKHETDVLNSDERLVIL